MSNVPRPCWTWYDLSSSTEALRCDQIANFTVYSENFIDSSSSSESCVVAIAAALASRELATTIPLVTDRIKLFRIGIVGRLARGANRPYQPLCDDAEQRSRKFERLDSHVDQTGYSAKTVVGMKRAEHQVASQRRLNGDGSSFRVSHFTNHDDVRVLS